MNNCNNSRLEEEEKPAENWKIEKEKEKKKRKKTKPLLHPKFFVKLFVNFVVCAVGEGTIGTSEWTSTQNRECKVVCSWNSELGVKRGWDEATSITRATQHYFQQTGPTSGMIFILFHGNNIIIYITIG